MEIQALGGYEGVGRNMTVVRSDGAQLAFDCGIRIDSFLLYYGGSKEDFSRIKTKDLINIGAIPDLNRIKGDIDAFLVSHGHLDHIGALEKVVDSFSGQIFSTKYTSGLIERRLRKAYNRRVFDVNFKETIQINPSVSVEFVEVTHSIPQASFVALNTSGGNIIYACDFKFDDHSKIAKVDYQKIKQLGSDGVKSLIVESLDVGQDGKSLSEKVARAKVRDVLGFAHDNEKLIVATTFSTHLERIQTLVTEAHKLGRKVLILGTSYLPNCTLGEKLGLLDLPEGTLVVPKNLDNILDKINEKNRDEYFILVTGHQGEPDSVLSRLADKKLKFNFSKGDAVIFSSRTIPTDVNIANKSEIVDKLKHQGVRIFEDVHVSGHASKEEHRKLIRMLQPENIIPAHGDIRMIGSYFELAEEEGYKANDNIHLLRNGDAVTI
ncbi:MAG: MBL fold metallo-hydrolase [Candidatus Altiarchaeota archaeon]|nr:MBL fold metallo-hydrolase [Candidatus Altiarchaeota archaeon]